MGCTSSAVEDVSHAKARGSQVTPVGCCCATTSAAAAAASVNSSSETEPANIVDEAVTAKGHGARLAQGAEKIKTGGALVVAPISWQRGEVIGTGSFGRVHFGLNTASGELMAVKQIAYGGQPTDSVRQTAEALQREVRCLQGLSHENIVRYLGIERDDVHGLISIFLEYCAGGSIASLLERFGCFQETLARSYAFQILQVPRHFASGLTSETRRRPHPPYRRDCGTCTPVASCTVTSRVPTCSLTRWACASSPTSARRRCCRPT